MPRQSPNVQPSTARSQRETVALSVYLSSIGVLVAVWLGGFALRGTIWAVDMELIRRSGIFDVYGNNREQFTNTVLLLCLATAAYGVALWALRRGFPRSFEAAIAGSIVASLAILPVTPLTSPDAIHLAADVRTFWLHQDYPGSGVPGLDPTVPNEVDDPVAKEVRTFANAPSSYGPLAYAIGGAALPFVGDNVRANVFGVKVVAGVFLVLTALFTGLVARQLGYNPAVATAFVGLNPLMLWEYPGDGHNDTIMAAFGMVGLLFVLRSSWSQRAAGGGFAVLSALAKYSLGALTPLVGAWWFPRLRWFFAALILIVATWAFLTFFVTSLSNVGPNLREIGPAAGLSRNTPWYVISDRINADQQTEDRLFGLAYLLFGIFAAAVVARHPLRRGQDLAAAAAIMMFAFLYLSAPSLRHWYQIWYLPFIPICGRRWLVAAGFAFSVGGFLTILALNYSSVLQREMGVSDPVQSSILALWAIVGALAAGVWWWDESQTRQPARDGARRARRDAVRRRRGF